MSLGKMVAALVKLFLDVIKTIFKITLPIGWDELGVIATVSAVIVALAANKKASEQLKSALRMQEQSKNVGLLDRRIELAERIQSKRAVSKLTLQVLFNDEIYAHYTAWQAHLSEITQAANDLDTFFSLCRVEDGEGGHIESIRNTIEKYERDMSKPNCPQQVYDEYEAFCNEHIVWQKTGENEELTAYNHFEISKRIAEARNDAKKERLLLLQLIEKFISDSIQPVETKR